MYLTVDHSYYIFEDDYNSGDDQETAFVVGRGFDGCISSELLRLHYETLLSIIITLLSIMQICLFIVIHKCQMKH